jgi:multidrug resistance efflux pump
MQNQLYPITEVEDSIERHLADHAGGGRSIYLSLAALIVAGLVALPLVRVAVSVQSNGIIRPLTEKHEVTAGAAGFAERLAVREGAAVKAGETMLVLRAAPLEERHAATASRLADARRFAADLEALASARDLATAGAATPRYRQELTELNTQLREIALRESKGAGDLARVRALFQRGLASQAEVEDREFAVAQARTERTSLVEQARSRWQSALVSARAEVRDLGTEMEQIREQQTLYVARSPVDGTVEELTSISPGSYVQAGQKLAVISPRSELLAEVFVTPRDIGLIRPGGPVRIQVDAFNYNDWGFVTGRVREISQDFVVEGQQPVFRVRVALDATELRLKNGFRGELRKGMTLRARFVVAERSLFQLLRDDLNDWLNPTQAG